ncbi:hypothetical protein GCM10009757_17630 [Streptomyces cheonanensis]|uniref:Uncharacterized protein n=1 Tax=Streptomyces cheonanensis TaxID=312720 RepID=A0ABN2V3S4_9ACTN
MQMGGEVVDGVTEQGQFPVDGPQRAVGFGDDEVVPVQIAVQQAERPVRQLVRLAGQRPVRAEYRIAFDAQCREQPVQLRAVHLVHPGAGEADQPAQEVPAGAGSAAGGAAVDEFQRAGPDRGQLPEQFHQVRQMSLGERGARGVRAGEGLPLDVAVDAQPVLAHVVHGRDAVHAEQGQFDQYVFLRGEAPRIEVRHAGPRPAGLQPAQSGQPALRAEHMPDPVVTAEQGHCLSRHDRLRELYGREVATPYAPRAS